MDGADKILIIFFSVSLIFVVAAGLKLVRMDSSDFVHSSHFGHYKIIDGE